MFESLPPTVDLVRATHALPGQVRTGCGTAEFVPVGVEGTVNSVVTHGRLVDTIGVPALELTGRTVRFLTLVEIKVGLVSTTFPFVGRLVAHKLGIDTLAIVARKLVVIAGLVNTVCFIRHIRTVPEVITPVDFRYTGPTFTASVAMGTSHFIALLLV